MRCRKTVFVAFSVLIVVAPAFCDTHDKVGIGWWGSSPLNARYWFPAHLQWCRDSLGQPFLVQPSTCNAVNDPVDQLDEGAGRIVTLGSRVIYVTLNANPRSFYMYTNPILQPSVFVNPAENRLRTAAAARPYANLFTKGFTTFIMAVFSNVPVCTNPQDSEACPCGTTNCIERPHLLHLFGMADTPTTAYRGAPVLDGLTDYEATVEKLSMKNLTIDLLNNPNLVGKTVVWPTWKATGSCAAITTATSTTSRAAPSRTRRRWSPATDGSSQIVRCVSPA